MKITVTFELDQETSDLIQSPLKRISQLVNELTVRKPEPDVIKESESDIIKKPVVIKKSEPLKKVEPSIGVRAAILDAISKSNGVSTLEIQRMTGLTNKQVSNNVFHLKKANLIKKTKNLTFVTV